jgi:putative transposase
MSVLDAKRLKDLEIDNTRLKKLLAESPLEDDVTREALRNKW